MKIVKIISLIIVLMLTGVSLNLVKSRAQQNSQNSGISPSPTPTADSFPPPYIPAKPEGVKLPLKYKCLQEDDVNNTTVIPVSSGRVLIGVCDTLYMLDSQRKVLWEYAVPQTLIDFAYIDATGLIYGTAGDNTMFIVDASSGNELFSHSNNGSAGYGEVKPFGKDICLIRGNNAGYRYNLNDASIRDGISAWRGTEKLWSADFPPDADLVVSGNQILAVNKSKDGVYVKEIEIPKQKKLK